MWLAGYLAVQNFGTSNSLLSMDLPASISDRVLNALKASPQNVDLSTQAPYFYKLAALALELFEEDEIVEVLIEVCSFWQTILSGLMPSQTFRARAAEIADHAHNSRGILGEGADVPKGLDELEKKRPRLCPIAVGVLLTTLSFPQCA